eukprot:CAMPEP_0119015954 /NCGR_PEP_ID=MMETSP1176-20130426/11739_1 /TAXON_ID=265551 /ORGANISM="Synedropsis recta cf, Strain CCMP1620" /LENGTH=457 /DNA_ID=CAMNT_0006969279 /DNA_START=60 /DNA_END=1433 /DNA_ORIENTATION=+
MKLVPSDQPDSSGLWLSPTVRSLFMGVGLMAFSVLLSVIDRPHDMEHNNLKADTGSLDRRAQQVGSSARELVKGGDTLRIAAFGSSNMWGAGLDNRYDAFPYLLSDEVDNFAMFAGGPNYPAACAETMVGDDHTYDAIIFDYWLKAGQGLPELARRLRQRFPNAIMVFFKTWGPVHARRRPTEDSTEEITFEEWKTTQYFPAGQVNDVIIALQKDTGYWYFPEHHDADVLINDVRNEVGGFFVRIPKKATGKETLEFYLHFFNKQNAQLSPMGHAFLAKVTKQTIKNKLIGSSTQELVSTGVHGHWGRGDECHVWYTTGGYNEDYSETLKMREFDSAMGKFALEVTGPGWFNVHNRFDDDRILYLSFLASQIGFYPVATITIGEGAVPIDLLPHTDTNSANAHSARTIPVGTIPPGKTKIFIAPKEEGSNFFRLVGSSITNEIAVPLEYGFGPAFNS